MQNHRLYSGLFLLVAGLSCAAAPADDWPQWRGPTRDGASAETGLLQQWPAAGPKLVWRATGLGAGFSTVSVSGSRIYTAGDLADANYVVAFNRADGKFLWKAKLGKTGGGPAGPRGTPTVDGNFVYELGQHGDLVCVEAVSGREVWRKNLKQDFNGECGGWLYSESVLVDGPRVICTPGGPNGTLLALNKADGQVLWRCKDWTDHAEYSSPIVETVDGVRQYIQLTAQSVGGVEARTGKLLWRANRGGETAIVPTPIYRDHHVYVTSGYGVGCNLFKLTSTAGRFAVEQVYANRDMVNHHGGVILVGDYLYGFSDDRGWVCQDFKTGKILWRNKGVGKGALAYADGHLYLRSEGSKGTVALVEARPTGYKETGRFDQPERSGSESWPHPVVVGGRLYLRDQDLLLCYDVKASGN